MGRVKSGIHNWPSHV